MSRDSRGVWRPGFLIVSCLVAVACGQASVEERVVDPLEIMEEARPLAPGERIDLAGVEIWLGSPESTVEGDATSGLLAEITSQAYEAQGATVMDRTELGSGFLLRDNLLSGEIDLYWQGAGNAWSVLLREPEETDREILFDSLRQRDLLESGVAWVAVAAFDDTIGMAVGRDAAGDYGLVTLSDMAEFLQGPPDDLESPRTCVTGTFRSFPTDGQLDVETSLGFRFDPDDLKTYDAIPIYPDTARGNCIFGEVKTTNGRIDEYDLVLLTDDQGVFPTNPPALAMREDVLLATPDLARLAVTLGQALDQSAITEMNRRVGDGEEIEAVARSWLISIGLVTA